VIPRRISSSEFQRTNVSSSQLIDVYVPFIRHPTTEVGSFLHGVEGEMVCRLTHVMIPYFNAGIYLENKSKIGKVEEVFGPINKVYFTIKPDNGVNATSFKVEDKVYIGTDKLLPLARFTNESKPAGRGAGGGRGAGRGAPGGRGGGRGFAGGRGGAGGRSFGGSAGRGPGRGGASGFSRGGGRGGGRGRG
jgi:H/ACA ribonucleoprotein complex subunit 1